MKEMATPTRAAGQLTGMALISLLLVGCASKPVAPDGAAQVRADLTRLQSDPQLAPLVTVELRDADAAVLAAETPTDEEAVADHRVYLAIRRIEIARALAEARQAEKERQAIAADRDKARLTARESEADAARQKNVELQREIDALQAQATDRGIVLTLGDVLFETGRADLKAGATADLGKLVTFLGKYPERSVIIEGHTDNVGGEDFNLGLSQRRADAVRSYLLQQGVDASRIEASGMGEGVPVASNGTATGRQQNRRVEIIISNPPPVASR